jgi:hypothetical protein
MFEIGNSQIQRCKLGVKGDTCDEGNFNKSVENSL